MRRYVSSYKQKGYIVLDCETTGLDPVFNTILTFCCQLFDNELNPIAKPLSLKLKPRSDFILYDENDKDYYFESNKAGLYVAKGALKKNKIDLALHVKQAVSMTTGYNKLWEYVKSHIDNERFGLIGQNVEFDKRFILESGLVKNWDRIFNREVIDTKVITSFLKVCDLLPRKLNTSLGIVADHFDISTEKAHTAEGDVQMTFEVLLKQVDLVKQLKSKSNILTESSNILQPEEEDTSVVITVVQE